MFGIENERVDRDQITLSDFDWVAVLVDSVEFAAADQRTNIRLGWATRRTFSITDFVLRYHLVDINLEPIDRAETDFDRRARGAKVILDSILGYVGRILGATFIRTMLVDRMTLTSAKGQGASSDEWLVRAKRAFARGLI